MSITVNKLQEIVFDIMAKKSLKKQDIAKYLDMSVSNFSKKLNGKLQMNEVDLLKLKELENKKNETSITPLEERMIRLEVKISDDIYVLKRTLLECCNEIKQEISDIRNNEVSKKGDVKVHGQDRRKVNQT